MTHAPSSSYPIYRELNYARDGQYRFADHGRSCLLIRPESETRRRDRRHSRQRHAPYVISVPAEFNLAEFARPERLMTVFRFLRDNSGQAPGEDDLGYHHFSDSEMFSTLRAVHSAIVSLSYRPGPARLVRIPKGDGRFRELRLPRIVDRIVASGLQQVLNRYWSAALPNLRRDVWMLFAELECEIREHGWYTLVTDDIRDCFPSLRIPDVLTCFREHICTSAENTAERPLMWLIETILRGHEGAARQVGLDQGSPCSPLATELTLHTVLDLILEEQGPEHPLLLRYVDNLNFLCSSALEGRQVLTETRNILAEHGLTLKGEDGDPVDIRDPDHGRVMLGLIPVWEEDHLGFRLPESSYQRLSQNLEDCWENPNPIRNARRVIEGWIRAVRPVFENEENREIADRVMDAAAEAGIREIPETLLTETVRLACHQWREERNTVFERRQRHPSG